MAFDGFRKIRCPFCAKEQRLSDFAVYSEATGKVTKPAPHNPFKRFAAGVLPPSLEGRENAQARNLRQCPKCQKRLPFNVEYVEDNVIIAIIGDTFAGKSHFIAAAIQQLKEGRVPPEFGLTSFRASTSDVEKRYKLDYYDPLFKRGEPLQPTPPAISPLDDPLIYEMRIGERHVNLLIYDASGEEFAGIDISVEKRPHILNAQALIFLADPWSIPSFVDQLAHHLRPDVRYRTGRMSVDVLNNVINVFKRALGEAKEPQFSLPVAIALSKSDLIPYVVTPSGNSNYQALSDARYPSTFASNESDAIHAMVKQFLYEVKEYSLLSMEKTIERVNFSAITATGVALDSQGKYPKVVPHRCLDPLFWVFRELEILP
jgi:hypothetical protein